MNIMDTMDTEHSCSCCLLRQPAMDLKIPYTRFGKTEIYADMLKECFEIQLKLSANDDSGICEVCVGRLRDASDFKLQVQRSQAELRARLEEALCVKEEEPPVKSEISDDTEQDEELILQELKFASEDPLPADSSDDFTESVMISSALKQEQNLDFTPNSEIVLRSRRVKTEGVQRLGKPDNTCDTCGKKFVLKTELVHHKRLHIQQRYNCTFCEKLFKFKTHLDLHNKRHHGGENIYTCEVCNKKFANNRAMNKHKRVHLEKRFRCGECNKLFSLKRDLKAHQLRHLGEIVYNCDMCGAKYKSKPSLIAHIGKHTGTKHYPCDLCTMKFWDYGSMFAHKRIHAKDTPSYTCDVCHKVYTVKSNLVRHLKTHLGPKYPCEFCPATLTTLGSLKLHKITHTDERKYPCEYCNKRFRYKQNLLVHIHIHTGEKPYCCEICGKQFARRDNLKTHLATHAEGVRYQCELCTKSYPTKECLRQHKRTHTKSKDVTKRRVRKRVNKIEYIGNVVPA